MKFGSGEQRIPRRRPRAIAVAAVLLLCCCAALAVTTWDGRNTNALTIDQAWAIIESPRSTTAQRELAATQLFRIAEDAEARLEQLANRNEPASKEACRLLNKLRR